MRSVLSFACVVVLSGILIALPGCGSPTPASKPAAEHHEGDGHDHSHDGGDHKDHHH